MIALAHASNWLVEDADLALRKPLRRNLDYLEMARKRMNARVWTFLPMPE